MASFGQSGSPVPWATAPISNRGTRKSEIFNVSKTKLKNGNVRTTYTENSWLRAHSDPNNPSKPLRTVTNRKGRVVSVNGTVPVRARGVTPSRPVRSLPGRVAFPKLRPSVPVMKVKPPIQTPKLKLTGVTTTQSSTSMSNAHASSSAFTGPMAEGTTGMPSTSMVEIIGIGIVVLALVFIFDRGAL